MKSKPNICTLIELNGCTAEAISSQT